MTKIHSIAQSVLAAGLALAGTLISFSATTSTAHAAAAPRYQAQLATALPSSKTKIINNVVWNCAGNACSAEIDGSRPLYTCIKVAKAFGPLTAFEGPKGAFGAEVLSKCNAGKA